VKLRAKLAPNCVNKKIKLYFLGGGRNVNIFYIIPFFFGIYPAIYISDLFFV